MIASHSKSSPKVMTLRLSNNVRVKQMKSASWYDPNKRPYNVQGSPGSNLRLQFRSILDCATINSVVCTAGLYLLYVIALGVYAQVRKDFAYLRIIGLSR
jgi:hypothetical protein